MARTEIYAPVKLTTDISKLSEEDKKVVAIPVAHLAKGMYMVRIQSSTFNQADKLMCFLPIIPQANINF